MAEYMRMVSYLNMYKNGEKKQNCGFAKIDSRNGICRVSANIQLPFIRERFVCNIYFFLRKGERMYGIPIGSTTVENGKGFAGINMVSSDIGHMGYGIGEIAGMYLTTDEESLVLASEWDDIPIHPEQFRIITEQERESPEPDGMTDGTADTEVDQETDTEEKREADTEEKENDSGEEKVETAEVDVEPFREEERRFEAGKSPFWLSLGRRCVRIDPLEGLDECIRMKPNDIVCLPKNYWALGQNSFLLHGYYQYRYLLAARYFDGEEEKYLLGVPGVFHPSEKIMAAMFGFDTFVGKENEGEKGYWCMNLQ